MKLSPPIKLTISAVTLLLLLIAYKFISIRRAMSAYAGPPPEAVTAYILSEETWQPSVSIVGTLAASQGVILSAESAGKVVSLNFESGSHVKQGQLLVQMDASVEQAQLKAATAKLELAQVNLKRTQNLRQQNATAESTLNEAVAQLKESEGQVEALKAQISHKTITAPFDGQAGIRLVNIGQFLSPGTAVVPLYSLNQLFLNFQLPQQQVNNLKLGQKLAFELDAYPGVEFSAALTAIDPQVDETNRSLRVQATIENLQDKLKPGMFAKVKLEMGAAEKIITAPSSAISYAPYGNSVYIIENIKDPSGKEYLGVRQQFVKVGSALGDKVTVLSGVKPGEKIVASGIFKLRPGAAVLISPLASTASETQQNLPNT